jgi:lipopolysaccharide/colanic/teichoic acid biosynthesis glycosyltransferase
MKPLASLSLFLGNTLSILLLGAVHRQRDVTYGLSSLDQGGWLLLYAIITTAVAYSFGLPEQSSTSLRIRSAILTAVVSPAIVSLIQVLLGGNRLPRFVLLMSIPTIVVCNTTLSSIISKLSKSHASRARVLVIANEQDFQQLETDRLAHSEVPCVVAGRIDPTEFGQEDLTEILDRVADVAFVVVQDDLLQDADKVRLLTMIHNSGLRIRTLSQFYSGWLGKTPLRYLEAATLLFDIKELHRSKYTRLARMLDLSFGCIALVVMVPLSGCFLIANRFGNRGPLFFSQPRVGQNQQVFNILKFRTMRPGSSNGEWTAPSDDRITRFGRWMRLTHLDELPQCINIIRGDLSLVGPRPEQPQYVEMLATQIPFYRVRHMVKPGLTGWAQVNYPYGADEVDAFEKLQYEIWYLKEQSLLLDLRILARTVRHVIGLGGR